MILQFFDDNVDNYFAALTLLNTYIGISNIEKNKEQRKQQSKIESELSEMRSDIKEIKGLLGGLKNEE